MGSVTQPLPWISAWSALVVVASSTAVGNYLLAHIMVLRCSPFYCLCDTLNLLVQFARCAYGTSFRQGLRTVGTACAMQAPSVYGGAANTRPIAVTWVLPAIATTQFIKLLACSGVPWTQAFACMYMSCYIARVVFGLFAQPVLVGATSSVPPSEKPIGGAPTNGTTSQANHDVSIESFGSWLLPQFVLWAWVISYFAPDMKGEVALGEKYPLWYLVLALPITGIIVILAASLVIVPMTLATILVFPGDVTVTIGPSCALLYAIHLGLTRYFPRALKATAAIFDAKVETVAVSLGVPLALVGIYWQAKLLGAFHLCQMYIAFLDENPISISLQKHLEANVESYIASAFQLAGGTLILFAVGATSYIAFRVFFVGSLRKRNPLGGPQMTDLTWLCAFTVLANAAVAMVYYSLVYNAQATMRPMWAALLG